MATSEEKKKVFDDVFGSEIRKGATVKEALAAGDTAMSEYERRFPTATPTVVDATPEGAK